MPMVDTTEHFNVLTNDPSFYKSIYTGYIESLMSKGKGSTKALLPSALSHKVSYAIKLLSLPFLPIKDYTTLVNDIKNYYVNHWYESNGYVLNATIQGTGLIGFATTNKEVKKMSTKLIETNVVMVEGTRASELNEEQLLAVLKTAANKLKKMDIDLDMLSNKPKRLVAKRDELQKEIDELVAYIDRDVKEV